MTTALATPPKLPVIVITGFLGSGKTTLLNRLLQQYPQSALIINEFGATPVDQDLLQQHDIPLTVLAGGCLCCQVRETLAPTLRNLWMAWNADGGRRFQRLFIETSGVASPEPVLDTLLRDRWLRQRLVLQGVVATLSAARGAKQLADFAEASAQVAWADRLVLTQADLAQSADIAALTAALRTLAPATPQEWAVQGVVDAADWFDAPVSTAAYRPAAAQPLPAHQFHSASVLLAHPVAWPQLATALQTLLHQHPSLLRVKGIVPVQGQPQPVVVQGAAGHLFAPVTLPPRPLASGGRLVLIGNAPVAHLAAQLQAAVSGAMA